MNRRGFLSRFLKGGLAAIAAPQIITHGLNLNFRKQESLWVPNPEWEAAEYRISWCEILKRKSWPENMGQVERHLTYNRFVEFKHLSESLHSIQFHQLPFKSRPG